MSDSLPLDSGNQISTVEEAYRYCRAITHRYGANFSVGFRFLPRRKRNAVYAAYAFARIADDIADEPGGDVQRRLDAWQRELERAYEGLPEHPVTVALSDALQHFAIPSSAFVALIEGCRQDLEKRRYTTFDELLGYCELVATSISEMSLPIFGFRTEAAHAHGRELATALQLTNITRDVGDDLGRDRIYIPQEELDRFGVTEIDLRDGRATSAVRELILFQVGRARGYFERARPLLSELAFDARLPTTLMGSVYAAVLRKIEADPAAPLSRRIQLSTAEKLTVVATRLLRRSFL